MEVDEAHHTPAKTRQQILVNLSVATHVLFTATPFRLDRKELSCKIYCSMSFNINAEFPEVCNVAGRILRNKS